MAVERPDWQQGEVGNSSHEAKRRESAEEQSLRNADGVTPSSPSNESIKGEQTEAEKSEPNDWDDLKEEQLLHLFMLYQNKPEITLEEIERRAEEKLLNKSEFDLKMLRMSAEATKECRKECREENPDELTPFEIEYWIQKRLNR